MKYLHLLRVFLLTAVLLLATLSFARTNGGIVFSPATPLEVSNGQGLAAAFCGMIDGEVIVAGGANFPGAPVQKGGEKVFYDRIYRFVVTAPKGQLMPSGCWEERGRLPKAMASGASVTCERGVVCIGGTDGTNLSNEVWLITRDGVQELPSLPVALCEHAACYHDGKVYVIGGQSPGHPSGNKAVYVLDLSGQQAWQPLCQMPGKSRLQSIASIQTSVNGPCLYVFGGYTTKDEPSTKGKVQVQTDGLCLDLKTMNWNVTKSLPVNVTGGACVNSGYSHIIMMGGFDKDIFEQRVNDPNPSLSYFCHPDEWYRFNRQIIVYHTITNSFFTLDENELTARCGASLVCLNNGEFMLVCGESRPAVRSTLCTRAVLKKEVSFGWLNWSVLVVYLLGMLALGFYFMRRETGGNDFFRGGGRIPWWAAGISIYATMLSALTYMSIPAKAYTQNWTYYPILFTIIFVSGVVVKYYLPYFRRLNITSAYEYLEHRFNLTTRVLASSLFIVFMVARMALVLYLPSLALNAVTGINVQLCIVLMGLVTIVYCTMGGVEAVVWGDVIQGIILVGGAFFAAAFLILHTEGGFAGFMQIGVENEKFRLFEWSWDYRSVTFWVAIIGGLANNLISYTSDQTVIQRYLTTKDEKSAAQSIWTNGIMCVFVSIIFYVIGTGLYTFFQTHPDELDITMQKGDAIFPYFMMSQLPAGLAGLLIAAIFAATMSTISSNINSIATAYSVDFYKRFRSNVDDHQMLRVARNTCFISGVVGVFIALLMASWNILSLIDYFNTILGLLTGGLGGLFFIGVFMKRVQGTAALSGFVCGTAFVFWLTYCTDASLFLYGASGMLVSVVVAWLVQMVMPSGK